MKKTWIYYGIFFSDKTKQAILEYAKYWIYKKFNNDIPDDWKIYCDHVTLVFNDGTAKAQEDADFYENQMLGQSGCLSITDIGISNKAIAFKVGYYGKIANRIPHITVAVAPDAKPVNSNDIENWYNLGETFYVTGKINKVVPSKKRM